MLGLELTSASTVVLQAHVCLSWGVVAHVTLQKRSKFLQRLLVWFNFQLLLLLSFCPKLSFSLSLPLQQYAFSTFTGLHL
jgi:hypothetical protein